MSPARTSLRAWQPLTPRGVAAFALAPLRRLLVVQFVFASLVAASAVWFLHTRWFPVVDEAVRQLPDRSEIQSGKLIWPEEAPRLLAGGQFVAVAVDLDHTGRVRSPAHVQVEFGRRTVRFISLFGYADCHYASGAWVVAFNRDRLQPWWGAWRAPILGISFVVLVAALLATWALLATIAFPAIRLAGFFANRDLNLRGSWKLAGAALLPGALLLTAAICGYALGILDLVQLAATGVVYLVAGGIYSFVSVFQAPRIPLRTVGKGNPFQSQ